MKTKLIPFILACGLISASLSVLRADDAVEAGATALSVPPAESKPVPGTAEQVETETAPLPKHETMPMSVRHRGNNDRIGLGRDTTLAEGEQANSVISIIGSSTSAGEVGDMVISIVGNTRITGGTVRHNAVAILGNVYVNGHVQGEVVAILGNVELGPEAIVDREIVCIGGRVIRNAGAIAPPETQQIGFGTTLGDFEWLGAWIKQCLRWGRPLWVGDHLGWAWLVAAGFLIFYLLLAVLFPRGLEKCAVVMEEKPGGTVLAALLTVLLTPLLIVLLISTVVGIPLVPLLLLMLFLGSLFGKAAVHAWIGRCLTRHLPPGPGRHVMASVLFGGLLITVLYLVPVLGLLLWQFFGVLGLGMVVYQLMLSLPQGKPTSSAAGPAAGLSSGMGVAALPPVVSAATLPRAGFWLRLLATFLDFVVVAMVVGLLKGVLFWAHLGGMPLWFAVYHVVMWATKGATVGGIVCGLRVVRLDDRPIDWGVAVVRSLGSFLSLAVAGLGFLWVAFDDDRQSWHDKIAGTTIVRMPKGTPLL